MYRVLLSMLALALALAACDSPSTSTDGGLSLDGGAMSDAAPARCAIARCVDGVATTCDGAVRLDCTAFGGECVEALTEDGDIAGWCSCGRVPEGGGLCGPSTVECIDGLAYPTACPAGTTCDDVAALACYCDDQADGICPDTSCIDDPDCDTCVPDCTGRACGDNGCGGACGSCALGTRCESGACVSTCVPGCAGRECGPDGCGGTCGTCPVTGTCDTSAARCVEECVPDCDGHEQCYPDGCGGDCGPACAPGLTCVATSILASECACPTDSRRDLTVDGSAVNWGPVLAVSVELRSVVGALLESPTTIALNSANPTRSGAIWACDATTEMEARITYYVRASGAARPCSGPWHVVPFGTLTLAPLAEPVSTCGVP